ncbi:MAG TPA: VOC family protein [Steroidobacteraceae bacterium]|nr:VOC family protein [Steroidobacteraceae bacterium]
MTAPMPHRPAFIPSVIYKDNRAALEWLRKAFGFEVSMVLTDSQDNVVHAEMSHDEGVVMIGSEFAAWTKSPASIGGSNTQRVHVRLAGHIDEHCARARQAGAKIVMEPADQFYGDRTYMAVDLEGHHWTFAQAVKEVSYADMEQATGFKFKPLQ